MLPIILATYMAAPDLFPFVDRLIGGDLAERLRRWRAEGLSYRRISLQLRDDAGIDVTGETIRRWCNREDIKRSLRKGEPDAEEAA